MAAELSLMISENGGNVVWVQVCFILQSNQKGSFWRFYWLVEWILQYVSKLLQSCIASSFVCRLLSYEISCLAKLAYQRYLQVQKLTDTQAAFVLLNTVLNILGLRWISRLSLFFLIFVLSPFVVEIALVIIRHEVDVKVRTLFLVMNDM